MSSPTLEGLPKELMQNIANNLVNPSHVALKSGHGCVRYARHLAYLTVSRKVYMGYNVPCTAVVVSFWGDAQYRPSVVVPLLADSDCGPKIDDTWHASWNPFAARILLKQRKPLVDKAPTFCTVVITLEAACQWLAIIGCKQHADSIFMGSSASFQLRLEVSKDNVISKSRGGNLYRAVPLMLHGDDKPTLKLKQGDAERAAELYDLINTPRKDAIEACIKVYSASVSMLSCIDGAASAMNNSDALDQICAVMCKLAIGLNRKQAREPVEGQNLTTDMTLWNQSAAVSLMNSGYEYACSLQEGSNVEALKRTMLARDQDACTNDGCPCFVNNVLLAQDDGQSSQPGDPPRHTIDEALHLEIFHWGEMVHLHSKVYSGVPNAVEEAYEQMLDFKTNFTLIALGAAFMDDLDTLEKAARDGIRALADDRGINMPDDAPETEFEVLRAAMSLERTRVENHAEWQLRGNRTELVTMESESLEHATESDLIQQELMSRGMPKVKPNYHLLTVNTG